MISLNWIHDFTGWFSPEQRMKAKRIKKEKLKEERKKIMKLPSTPKRVKRVAKIDKQLEAIMRDLSN